MRALFAAISLLLLSSCASIDKETTDEESAAASINTLKSLKFRSAIIDRLFLKEPGFANQADLPLEKRLALARTKELKPDARYLDLHTLFGALNSDPSHEFANLLAALLTDENFNCRFPGYAQYFSSRFEVEGHKSCSEAVPFRTVAGDKQEVVWINPNNVSEVHLVLAGKGKTFASRFGHIGLRLIVCPEGGPKNSESCDLNVQQHLVLSYRAHIDDFQISNLKGLMGSYDAYLFAHDFIDTYRQYAIGEFREIKSAPLNVSAAERVSLIRAMSQVHWGFSGQYKFFTNNCANLMQRALSTLIPRFKVGDLAEEFWRPDRYFAGIMATDFVNSELLDNLSTAEEGGYYFPSTRPIYEEAFQNLSKLEENFPYASIDEYLKTHPRRKALQLTRSESYKDALIADPRLLESQVLLDGLSLLETERRLLGAFANFIDRSEIQKMESQMKNLLSPAAYERTKQCLITPIMRALKPVGQASSGIPVNGKVLKESLDVCESESSFYKHVDELVAAGIMHGKSWEVVKKYSDALKFQIELNMLWEKIQRSISYSNLNSRGVVDV
jgi:hypothetical protein